jgi:hypothetical protein
MRLSPSGYWLSAGKAGHSTVGDESALSDNVAGGAMKVAKTREGSVDTLRDSGQRSSGLSWSLTTTEKEHEAVSPAKSCVRQVTVVLWTKRKQEE